MSVTFILINGWWNNRVELRLSIFWVDRLQWNVGGVNTLKT